MNDDAQTGESGAKILAATRTRLRLIAACGAVLLLGSALAPQPAETPLPSPEQGPAPLLEEQVQRSGPVIEPFVGVHDVAARARPHVVRVVGSVTAGAALFSDFSDVDRPAPADGFGVFVGDGYILTHADALSGQRAVRLANPQIGQVDATVAAYEPGTGLVLLRTEAGGPVPAFAAGLPAAGSLALAAGRTASRDLAVPMFVTSVASDRFAVGALGETPAPGLPIFAPDGTLLAVTSGPAGLGDVFPAGEAVVRLVARAEAGAGVFGLAVQGLTGSLATLLGDRGVVVTDVIADGPAAVAGIEPGDVVVAVGEADITTARTAATALSTAAAGQPATFRLLRRGREQSIDVTPVDAYALTALSRVAASGPLASAVLSAPELAAAGIPAEAIVLRIDGAEVVSASQAGRALRSRQAAVPLLLTRDGVAFMVVLEAPQ